MRLRLVDRFLGVQRIVEAEGSDLAAGTDQASLVRLVLDDSGIVLDVGGCRHSLLDPRQVSAATDPLQHTELLQLRRERHVVDRLAFAEQVEGGAIDLCVVLAVEILGVEEVQHPGHRRLVQQDGAQYRGLSLEVLRLDSALGPAENGCRCHGGLAGGATPQRQPAGAEEGEDRGAPAHRPSLPSLPRLAIGQPQHLGGQRQPAVWTTQPEVLKGLWATTSSKVASALLKAFSAGLEMQRHGTALIVRLFCPLRNGACKACSQLPV